MPIHDFHQSFNSGELTPLLDSRVNVEKYASGCLTLENLLPLPHGPVTKRAGAVYMFAQETPATGGRLHGFQFGDTAHAVAEMSMSQIRFIEAGAVAAGPYATTWLSSELAGVKFAQVNNIIYGVHPDNAIHRIVRDSSSSYSIVTNPTPDYPALLDENITDTTITPSAATGSITLTASTSIFTADNIGSYYEVAQVRTATFAEVVMGDSSTKASKALTFSAAPADGDTLTLNSRVYTYRTAGRDAADEIDVGDDADDAADNTLAAINAGGGGADPHPTMEAEEMGGLKASMTFGNTTGTNISDNDTVTVGKVVYTWDNVGTWQEGSYVVRQGSTLLESLTYLKKAINKEPRNPDTPEYWDAPLAGQETLANPDVEAVSVDASGSGYLLTVRAREQGAGGNKIPIAEVCVAAEWTGSAVFLAGGTRVINIQAKLRGAAGNALTIAESSTALAFAGGATALSGGGDETDSSSVTVLGKVEVRTNGRWTGTLELRQLRDDLVTYDTIHAWKSQNDYNVSFQADFATHTTLQLRFIGSAEKMDNVWPRAILEPTDPYHRGIVKVTAYTSGTIVTATVIKTLLSTTATKFWSEGAWSTRRGFPRTVCFYQNRMWFAGTDYEPSKIWASQLGDFENFRITSNDDGGLAFQLSSTNNQQILWLIGHHDLIVGTDSGVWTGKLADGVSVVTPTNPPIFRERAGHGCADVQPVLAGESVVYVHRYGRIVRRLFHDGSDYQPGNLTALAEHITRNGITQLAVQTHPETVLWAISESNGLATEDFCALSFTLDAEQNVFAWSRNRIYGSSIQSVAVVYGSTGSEVWFITNVNLNGRSCLRLDPSTHNRTSLYQFSALSGIYLDCTVTRTEVTIPFTTVTIPACLVGQPVTIRYANGTTSTTTPGSTTLTVTSTLGVTVGIAIRSTMRTMRLEYPMRDGTAQGRTIKVNSAALRLSKSQGGKVKAGPGEYTSLAYTTATTTYTGEFAVPLSSSHYNDGTVTVYHDAPYPFTMTGLVIHAETGDRASNRYNAAEV